MFDFLQSNSQAFIIVSAIIIFGLLQLLKANKMLTEVVDKKINQNINNVLNVHCPEQQKECNKRFDKVDTDLVDLKRHVTKHSPNGELKEILKVVQNLESALK